MVDLGGPGVRLAAMFVAGLAALNHGLVEFLDVDLITQFVSTGSTEYQVLIGVISIAAVLVILDAVEEVDA